MPKTNEVLISFPSESAAKAFIAWMSDAGGEQEYFDMGDYNTEAHYVSSFEYDLKRNIIVGSGDIRQDDN